MVIITSYISGHRKIIVVRTKSGVAKWNDIIGTIHQQEGTNENINLICEGKPINSSQEFSGDVNIVATLKLNGGKGGFGSMLRAIGAQIEKTTNREACRDLSGRRLRDINEERRLKDFLAKKVEKEKEMLEMKRKKLEQMKEGPKHTFEDKTYFEQREKRERDIYESLDKAFASSSTGSMECSEKTDLGSVSKNKKKLFDEFDDDDDDDSSDEDLTNDMGDHSLGLECETANENSEPQEEKKIEEKVTKKSVLQEEKELDMKEVKTDYATMEDNCKVTNCTIRSETNSLSETSKRARNQSNHDDNVRKRMKTC